MLKSFYEINKAVRTQIRSRRESLNITQQELLRKIGKDFFENENHFENDKSILTRLESLPKEPANSELRNIDFELLYYVCCELGLKLDPILFPSGIPSLFTKDAFENSIPAKMYNIKHEFLDYIFKHYDDFSKKLKDKKIQLYYNDLLQSGLKSFLPPQVSFISGFAAGTTSLIYLLMGLKYKGNILLPENTDVFYIHSDFKPHFYPKNKNEFEFDKETFSLKQIFSYRNDFTVKADKKVTVKFFDAPILKYITIYDTKFVGEELSANLIEPSVHSFIVEPDPALRANQISKIITILGRKYNSKYTLANDILFRISILLSKKDSLLKKDEENIKSLIYQNINSDILIRNNLKDSLYKSVLNSIIPYDISNPESHYKLRQLLQDIISKSNIPADCFAPPLYDWYDSRIPLSTLELDVIAPIEQIKRVFNVLEIKNLYAYCQRYPEYLSGMTNYLSTINKEIVNKTNSFISEELNSSFLNNLSFIVFKENTKCINITKDFIYELSKCINDKIDAFILSIIWENGLIDRNYINSEEIKNKFEYYYFYSTLIFEFLGKTLNSNKNQEFVNEYIEDITNANRPTGKYFIKRFTEYKNAADQTLSEKIIEYLKSILSSVHKQLRQLEEQYTYVIQDSVIPDMECYIQLYEQFNKTHGEIKAQIKEKIYPKETFMVV